MAKRASNSAKQKSAESRRKALEEKAAAELEAANAELAAQDPNPEADESDFERTAEVAEFWEKAGIDPIEIALPGGNVGYTLRHYRTAMFYPEPEPEPDESELDEFEEFDDEFEMPETVQVPDDEPAPKRKGKRDDAEEPSEAVDESEPVEDAEEPEDGEELFGEEREEAVMLTHDGELHLFRTAQALVEFVASDAPHDLAEVEAFRAIKSKLRPELIAPAEEDKYELDLVVRNLRGGRDVWDADLLISAGEVARDAAHACGLKDALAALAEGSPLDTLDEGLRDGGFWARRRIRRLKPEQVALAWRGVIGKISAAVRWYS
ncbi:MAG TPA: hypothetical protein VHU91_07645 [Mycobacteriales bacterium]|nr:hypothetical protein [Mycobacteriales bacterium]